MTAEDVTCPCGKPANARGPWWISLRVSGEEKGITHEHVNFCSAKCASDAGNRMVVALMAGAGR